MSKELILMIHPSVGVLGVLAALWVFAETLNARPNNIGRIRAVSLLSAAFIWLAYLAGGYWYVLYYAADKALIKAGPWPFAHGFFMETKEHIFLSLLLVATLLPVAAWADIKSSRPARQLVYWSAALIVTLGLGIEGAGAFVAMGAKVALAAQ